MYRWNIILNIGPAVFTIAVILIIISLLYKGKIMLMLILAATILDAEYFAYTNFEFNNWKVFYQAEIVTLLLLSIVIITVHMISSRRSETINKQFNDIFESKEKLKLTLESVGDWNCQ